MAGGSVSRPTTRDVVDLRRFGSTGAASPPPPEDTPESAKRAVSADSSFASRGRTRGDVGASAEPARPRLLATTAATISATPRA